MDAVGEVERRLGGPDDADDDEFHSLGEAPLAVVVPTSSNDEGMEAA